jgi:hypothetical protein
MFNKNNFWRKNLPHYLSDFVEDKSYISLEVPSKSGTRYGKIDNFLERTRAKRVKAIVIEKSSADFILSPGDVQTHSE